MDRGHRETGSGPRRRGAAHDLTPGKARAAKAALNAVKQGVYTPTLLNGVPVPVIMTDAVNFKLS
jgi:hypothetical protein